MREVTPLQFEQTATKTTYGDGVFQLLTTAPEPDGYSILNAFALDIDSANGTHPEYDNHVPRPVSFCCKDECQKCNKIICSPDLGQAEPPTTGDTTSALRFGVRTGEAPGWSLDEANQMMSLTGALPHGPVFVAPAPPSTPTPTQVEAIRQAVATWLDLPRTTPIIMHMFVLRARSEPHPLADKVIAIPARTPSPPPP